MLVSSKTRDAFDLSRNRQAPRPLRPEPVRTEHDGGPPPGRIRRAFVSVHAENFLPNGSFTYDMHANNFGLLRDYNLRYSIGASRPWWKISSNAVCSIRP
ncbi:MAG: hypothetical protein CM1200mP2_52080 [Planctomycetaceae bacterium]|nr:MAG: hypothetical protein CM1200mP2_52080 [Planctomycetaceae bacterium]